MNTHRKRNLYILTFVLFVVMVGYGVVIPILPFYIERMGAGGTELGLLVASYAVMRLIFGPIWGSLSDRMGRKPILLIGIFGYAVTMIWFGLATELWMLFVARILSGILSSATAPTTMAFIGDSTPEEERGGGMGLLGAAGGVGTIFGPALGGWLGEENLSTPFFFAGGLALVSLILAVLFLPESHPAGQTEKDEKVFDLRAWGNAIFSPLGILFILTFLSTSGLMMFANVFGLYALEKFNFGTEAVGVMMMVLGIVSAVAQGAIAGPLTKRWGDTAIIQMSLWATALGFGMVILAGDFVWLVLAIAFLGLATALQIPALSALTSRRAEGEQGIAMGLNNSFISLGRIVGPVFAGVLFDWNIELPYIAGAGVMILSALFARFALKPASLAAQTT